MPRSADPAVAAPAAAAAAGDPSAANVVRFGRLERAVHWTNAILFLTLIVTGSCLYIPALSTLVSRRETLKTVHVAAGLLLPVPLLVAFLARPWNAGLRADVARLGRWTAGDKRWLRTFGRDRKVVVGKFNAGQKVNAALVAGAVPVMLATGAVMKWFSAFPVDWRTGATFVHDWGYLGLSLLVVGHIGKAIADPVALRSMVAGTVPRSWARHHRPGWRVEEPVAPAEPPVR